MTTTAHEDQFTIGTQTIEPVRQPYDTVAILHRNIAALEVALRTQTERAEAAEAELAKLREQEPVAWMHDKDGRVDTCHDSVKKMWIKVGQKQNTQFMREIVSCRVEHYSIPLYAAPVLHKGATHCDDCGLTWLDDGLNPLRCPYCKDHVPAPAVPAVPYGIDAEAYGIDAEASNRIALAFYDWVNRINQEPLLYAINRILATEAHPLSDEGQRALLQSARGAK